MEKNGCTCNTLGCTGTFITLFYMTHWMNVDEDCQHQCQWKAIPQVKEFVLKDSPPGGNSHDYFINKQPTKWSKADNCGLKITEDNTPAVTMKQSDQNIWK